MEARVVVPPTPTMTTQSSTTLASLTSTSPMLTTGLAVAQATWSYYV